MGNQATTKVKFQLIHETVQKAGNELDISALCRMAGVSRSGYYSWVYADAARQSREEQDRADFAFIQQAAAFRGYKKGPRGIYMRLLHQDPPVVMNPKKIRRLMDKYGLTGSDGRDLPFPQMTASCPPRQCFLTDITGLCYSGGNAYLAAVLDVRTHEILAWELSDVPRADFLRDTAAALLKQDGTALDEEAVVYSCRGTRLCSREFLEKLQDNVFVQSLSRGETPRKSFFGHLETELCEQLSRCLTPEAVRLLFADWVDYYNNDRYQWDLKMLSPREYAGYLQTGVSPITQGVSKNPEDSARREKEGVYCA